MQRPYRQQNIRYGGGGVRNISFSLTTEQFKARTKTVTRRLGWKNLKPGEVLMGCEKCMGLKPGEKINRLGRIRVVSVRQERLYELLNPSYGQEEVHKEGFPEVSWEDFAAMFIMNMKCELSTTVTRIEFEYLD